MAFCQPQVSPPHPSSRCGRGAPREWCDGEVLSLVEATLPESETDCGVRGTAGGEGTTGNVEEIPHLLEVLYPSTKETPKALNLNFKPGTGIGLSIRTL